MMMLASLHQYSDFALLALRIAVSSIFLAHGHHKWAMWKAQPSAENPKKMISLLRFLSIMEPLGALGVLFGCLTPFAALGLSFVMLGAINMKIRVWKKGFTGDNGWELDLIILAGNIVLIVMGAGAFALDRMIWGL